MRAKILIPFLLLAACGDTDGPDQGSRGELVENLAGRADSAQRPTDHGELTFGEIASAELTAASGFQAWEVTVHGEAKLTLRTRPQTADGPEVDTVVYLYRENASGWGRYVGRNDDAGGSLWSRLSKNVTAGRYRALVKGYGKRDLGQFALTVECDGEGCRPPAPVIDTSECLFGTIYNDLWEPRPDLQIASSEQLHATTPLTELAQAQVVVAVQQSSHDDVTTPAEAFAAVDEGEINRVFIVDAAGGGTFVAYEYGAGDNSYGAIFNAESTEPAASIHDGDLLRCNVLPQ